MTDQLYIKYHSFDSKADPTYKPPLKQAISDWFIGLRSYLKHTELEFPEIYGCISFSATNADGCKCARFKMIDYTEHPQRWKTVLISVTREQCDLMFAEACRMAGITGGYWVKASSYLKLPSDVCIYGPNALKYDLIGLLSFATRWEIIRPHAKWVWCTEACFKALQAGLPRLSWVKPEMHPEHGHAVIEADYGIETEGVTK